MTWLHPRTQVTAENLGRKDFDPASDPASFLRGVCYDEDPTLGLAPAALECDCQVGFQCVCIAFSI